MPPLPPGHTVHSHHIALSKAQEEQITEIFNLFDTDGGGTIDRSEMDFALVALGFHSAKSKRKNGAFVEDIIGDGKVTLEEFSALMMGELSGRDPQEMLRAAFFVLSAPDGNTQTCLLYTSPSPRDRQKSRMPSSA